MRTVALRSFDNYIEANIIAGRLRNVGIDCYLVDEFTVTIDPILTNALGGIKLTVADVDAEKAKKILLSFDEERQYLMACPKCGSENVEYVAEPAKKGNWFLAIFGFLLASRALTVAKNYHCFNCGHSFEELKNDG